MRRISAVLLTTMVLGAGLHAQETTVTVRVVAHDAKIIGSGVGGARVVITNAATGEVLAEGQHEGSTGSTDRIMVEPRARGTTIFDVPGAARFVARVALDTPTVVEIAAEGPLGYGFAAQRTTTTLLLIPGEDVVGDGVVLPLHGFIVELQEPEAAPAGVEVSVRARIRMMCGCPHTPGGLWDANRLRVSARVSRNGEVLREQTLTYAGEPNIFAGTISLRDIPSGATLIVLAADAERANFGKSEAVVID